MKTFTVTVVAASMAMSASQTMAATAAAPTAASRAAAAAPAPAPAAAAAPTLPPIVHGPPITGLCVMSPGVVQANSLYGKAIDDRMNVLAKAGNDSLVAEDAKIKADAASLDTNKATMTALVYNQQMLVLQDRANTLQTKAATVQNNLDYTQQLKNQDFNNELQVVAEKVYQDQKCSLLIDGQTVLAANPQMDLTLAVVAAMDKDKTTIAPFQLSIAPTPPAPTPTGG